MTNLKQKKTKKSPKKPLTLNITSETLIEAQSSFSFDDGSGSLYNVSDIFIIQNIDFTHGTSFDIGEVVFLLADSQTGSLPEDFNIRLQVIENLSGKTNVTRNPFNQQNQIQPAPYPPNTYSFQVLRYDKKYNNKTTTSSSGNWSEYLRTLKGSVRSDHPVFSVVAVGKLKNEICKYQLETKLQSHINTIKIISEVKYNYGTGTPNNVIILFLS